MTDNAMITYDATFDILLMMLYMYIYMDTTRKEEGTLLDPGA